MTKIAIVMGSISDWETLSQAAAILDEFGLAYDKQVVSAHRTPDLMYEFAKSAREKGYELIIAGAGGAAHLPGMLAALTTVPVIGVPVQSKALSGMDSLLSIVQMPAGVPVATMSIGVSGAKNAALYAIQVLALHDLELEQRLVAYREKAREAAIESTLELGKKP